MKMIQNNSLRTGMLHAIGSLVNILVLHFQAITPRKYKLHGILILTTVSCNKKEKKFVAGLIADLELLRVTSHMK